MPRIAGVSATSTVCSRWRRPSPFTDSRCLWSVPGSPFTRVTLIRFCSLIASSSGDLFDLLAALGGDLRRAALLCQPVERGAHDVVRIGRAVALGGDVGHTHHLEDRAHGTPGLDAVALGRGLHHDACRAMAAEGNGVKAGGAMRAVFE